MERPIRIATIAGSPRPANNTAKALALVENELETHPKVQVVSLKPFSLNLPFPGMSGDFPGQTQLHDAVRDATAVVFATPEYHGSFSALTKLAIENLGFPSVLSGKPIRLLGVASGQIGAIKALEHLRSVCSHVGAIVLPGPVSVAGVHKVFDEEGNCLDPGVEKRLRGLATSVVHYIEDNLCPRVALEQMVREEARLA